MKKMICAHPFLLVAGGFLTILCYGSCLCFLYLVLFNFSEIGIIGIIDIIILFPLCVCWHVYMAPHIFGMMRITETHIVYFGLFLPIVKLRWDEIKYVEIRTFKEKNVAHNLNDCVDAFKFVLLSTLPLPQKPINKIRTSKKQKIIKFAVSQKLCRLFVDSLPQNKTGSIKYQLYLYQKSRRSR